MTKNERIIRKVVRDIGGTLKQLLPKRDFFFIEIQGEKIFITQKFSIANSLLSRRQPTDAKDLTYALLKRAGLPTPNTLCVYQKNFDKYSLDKKLNVLSYPVIIKDASGSHSQGIFANIRNSSEAKRIILREIKNFSCLLVQKMIFGKEYRVLILGNKAIGILEMIPPRIFGNGKDTIRKLIEKKQTKTEKETPLDKALFEILKEQGMTLDTIPEKNREIFLRRSSCLAEGGETKDSTSLIDKKIKSQCIEAAKVLGRYLAGLDIICDDIGKSPLEQNFTIIEVNRKPDLYIHYDPTYGKSRNVIKDILYFILKIKKREANLIYINKQYEKRSFYR